MSDLTQFRDHALRMAGRSTKPEEAAVWQQLATEIDDYLNPGREAGCPTGAQLTLEDEA